jgi:hypothetical protein
LIVTADVELTVSKPMKARAWKGVIVAKAVYDAFKSIGVDPSFPFKVSPPEKLKPDLKPGSKLAFRVSFWGPEAEEAAGDLVTGLAALEWAVPTAVKVEEVKVEEPPPPGGEPVAVFFAIEHGPTFYRFHGAWVPLPSARRFVLSGLKRLSEATGLDLKERAESVADKLEAVGGRPKFSKYRIHFGE